MQKAAGAYLQNKTENNRQHHKRPRNACNTIIRNAERNFLIAGLQKPSVMLWKHLKTSLGSSAAQSSNFPWPANTFAAATKSADTINDYFVNSVAAICSAFNIIVPVISSQSAAANNKIFTFVPITEYDISVALASMAATASCRVDNNTMKKLRLSTPEILPVLCSLFNQSLYMATFPYKWKCALVTPVHKKGDVHDISNYQPISILSNVSKLFEKVIEVQVHKYLTPNYLMSPHQHDFMKGCSCETTLINLTASIFASHDQGLHSAIVALEYSRAFDSAYHAVLLNDLFILSFDHVSCRWFRSYLTDRLQSVQYVRCVSHELGVSSDEPKGSVTCPLLFNIYINDLLMSLPESSSLAYANDVTLVATRKSEAAATEAL